MITVNLVLKDIGVTCPVCGEKSLDAMFDDHGDGRYEDTYECKECDTLITYITPDKDPRQYHEYLDNEITVEFGT